MDTFEEPDRESMMETALTDSAEKKKSLQDLLREQMEMHIKEGRVSVERNQESVSYIKGLKMELHRVEESQEDALKESQQSGQFESHCPMEYSTLMEQLRNLKEDHEKIIQEELLKMEGELQEEQPEGLEGEVVYLNRERYVLVLQIEALRLENQQAEAALKSQYTLHQKDLQSLREECLEVFRTFRRVLEEQKRISEGRYRALLLETIQDAVYLSSQNQQLQAENMQLHKALAEMKSMSDQTNVKESPSYKMDASESDLVP